MTSLRVIACPECSSRSVETERLESNTHSLNVKATVTCSECGHVWEAKVSNPDKQSPWLLGLHEGNVKTRGRG